MKRLLLSLCLLVGLVTPLWASEEIGRQEDTASASGQVLMPVGCVRQDTIAASTDADGDYNSVKCNNVGRVYTSGAIDTALPAGSNAIGKLAANSGVIIGDVNVVNTPTVNAAITSQVPGTGTTNLGKPEDGAHVSGDTGVFVLGVRHDTSTTGLGIDGDYAALGLDANGRLYTNSDTELPAPATLADNTANPSLSAVAAYLMCFDGTTWDRCLPGLSDTDDDSIAFSQLTSLVLGAQYVSDGSSWIRRRTYLEDVAETAGMQLNMAGSVRRDTPVSSAGTSEDNATINTSSLGALYTQPIAGPAGGATPCYLTSAASTNSTNCKGSAGTLYTVSAVNTTATLYYLRLYNSSSAPTCSSATGFVETIPVPAATSGGGIVRPVAVGEAFGTGIGFCLTGGGSSTDNTNAATGVYLTLLYN